MGCDDHGDWTGTYRRPPELAWRKYVHVEHNAPNGVNGVYLPQFVIQDNSTDLPHLIGFRMAAVALQIDSLGDAFPSEYVMASSYPLGESQITKQTTQIVEADIGIRATPENSLTDAVLAAARAADLVLIPCRASVADLHAIGTSIEITRQARTTAAVILNAAPVQGPLVVQARIAIAGYEVEMVPVVLHHRIAHVHAFTDGLTAPELTRASKAGTELIAVFRWVQNKERSLNGQI